MSLKFITNEEYERLEHNYEVMVKAEIDYLARIHHLREALKTLAIVAEQALQNDEEAQK